MSDPALLLRVAVLPFQSLDAFGAGRTLKTVNDLCILENMQDECAVILTDELFRIAGARTEGEMRPELWQARNAVLALRRDVHNRRPMRRQNLERARPLLSASVVNDLERFQTLLGSTNEGRQLCEAAYFEELSRERRALLDLSGRPEFLESVWLASRSLFEALQKLSGRDVSMWRNEETHPSLKILAYLVRNATKTSPNALFAATSPAAIGSSIRVKGSAALAHVRTRLNVSEVRKVTSCLAVDPALKPMITPRLNPTLRKTSEGWSWWRPASQRRDEDEEVFLEAVHNVTLDRIVDAVSAPKLTWPELVKLFAAETNASSEDVERFLQMLVDRGFVLAEVEIPFQEPRPGATLAVAVREHGLNPAWLASLEAIETAIAAAPPIGSPDRRSVLVQTGQLLESLPHARPISQDELYRVDAGSSFRVEIPEVFRRELWQAADAYVHMFAALYPFTRRDFYADLFLKEFPADTDVPALDVYQRFSEPEFDTALGSLPPPPRKQDALQPLKARLLEESTGEVCLEIEEFLKLVPTREPGRWMAGALFQVAIPPGGDAFHPELRIVLNALFHGCGLALARFHDLHKGDAIAQTLRRGWWSLVPKDAIPAEINYVPWGRTANASLRPRLFDHEIELPGECASADVIGLSLRDLLLRFESTDRRFRITSRSMGRDVVPILSSGVRPQGFTSFLVHVGMQDLFPIAFFPGLDDPNVVHWPRLTLGRVAIFRERWVFGRDRVPDGSSVPGPRWFESIQSWRRVHGVPRRVFAGSARSGKPFFVDLESPLMTELFRRFLVSLDESDRCILCEMLPGPDQIWLRDETGSYASEFLTQLEGPLLEGGSL